VDPGKRLGKRERFLFRTEVEAKTKAQELRIRLANEGRSSARLSDRERDDAAGCLQRLRPEGGERTVHEVATEFMAADENRGRTAAEPLPGNGTHAGVGTLCCCHL
jgi:hypothetical protein